MIFYFSATGNSRYVAKRIAAEINEETISITDCMKSGRLQYTVPKGEKIGFVTPVYFLSLPTIVHDFLSAVEFTTEDSAAPYFFHVATFGTTCGQAGRIVDGHLQKKGLALSAWFSVQMPDTWTPVFDLSDKAKVAKINREAEKQIDTLCKNIREGKTGDCSRKKAPMALVKWYYKNYETVRATDHFTVEETCVGCGLCAANCPVDAIEIKEGKPVWLKDKCVMCLGCLHRCPEFSIQYGKKTKMHGQYIHPGGSK